MMRTRAFVLPLRRAAPFANATRHAYARVLLDMRSPSLRPVHPISLRAVAAYRLPVCVCDDVAFIWPHLLCASARLVY